MKRKILILASFFTLMLIAITTYSMNLASIDVPTCSNCSACWSIGEPFFEHPEGGAGWGIYESLTQWDMRFYAYPTVDHQRIITEGKNACPHGCINHN
jgi:ferredoxin